MGIARYAQNNGRRSARRPGMSDKYSFSAKKLTNAKKISDTFRLTNIAIAKMVTMIHQVLIRCRNSLKLPPGLSRGKRAAIAEAKTRTVKIPAKVHRTSDGRDVPIN